LTQGRVVDGGRDLDITFVADTPLPLLVTRSLHVRPDDDIETILSSDSFGIDPSLVGPVFRTPEMRRLVHLVMNAVLYAISLPAPWTVVGPERRSLSKRIGQLGGKRIKRDAAPPKLGHTRSGESLFLLPGKITISRLRELQACERAPAPRCSRASWCAVTGAVPRKAHRRGTKTQEARAPEDRIEVELTDCRIVSDDL